ncbi:type IV pilus assembly protein PilQ [Methylohalomonas lacus]|uniref:Type IV pilus assembly protein PilQ n=1 Tax=Methylohalomonas lacus TaxID=398773 RepID=A0AAE3L5W1_9GAMM|nr:type IV pilus secretin PilQ [Methylohalomonas lacus]MCS3904137.1 type IV pilus assembly protein PilQ [Methylohalomonas lacus]
MKTGHMMTRSSAAWESWLRRLLVACTLLSVGAQVHARTLDDVSYTSLPGDKVEVKLQLSEPLSEEPTHFTTDNPARIALDFPDTQLNLQEKTTNIGVGMAHSVSTVEASGRTRVVINLNDSVPYKLRREGNNVIVALEGRGVSAPSRAQSTSKEIAARTESGSASGRIENIDFRRGEQGEGRVIVQLSDPSVGVDMNKQGEKVVVDFLDTRLPEHLDRRLDVIDFATPVSIIDTQTRGNGVRMEIKAASGEFDHLAYQSGGAFTVELKPLSEAEREEKKKDEFGYTGERLSLNFQNIEVRAVLQLIADFTGLNMVASDSVGGNVTLRLKNVPWDQALDIILKSKGLGMRQDGNVIMVAPQEEIAAREKLELEAEQQIQDLEPLRTEFIQVNYAKAGDLASLMKAEANNLLSERGNVTVDERTNTLIVQDTGSSLQAIREMVVKLDVPVRQVLIESRIVNADESFAKDLGVKFGYSRNAATNPRTIIGGKIEGDTNFNGNTAFHTDDLENFIVDLPVANPSAALGLAVGKIGSYLLQLELSAALAEGRGEDISSPRVITANQREAVIESGVEIPYQEASSSGATSVSFKKAVLSLRVTPQITPDDRILLDLEVNQDTRGSPEVLGVPPIDTRSVTTQVLVDNGETVVLGGIYTQSDRQESERVPFFGDLPYLGFLFRNTSVSSDRTELLIFVTPKIMDESVNI